MRFVIFFIIYFAFQIALPAQSAGYMGKRLFAGYGFNTSPAIFGATAQNETIFGSGGSASSGSMVFNLIHEGFLEVAPSSKYVIGFSVRYYNTVYDNARELSSSSYLYSGGYSYLSNTPSGYYNIRGMSYTLYFRFFGRRYIAPWGRYFMFGPVLNTVKTEYDPAVMSVKAQDNYTSSFTSPSQILITDFGPREQDYLGVNLMFGAGRSRIIGKIITLDYGFNTHVFSLASGVFELGETGFFSLGDITHSNYIEKTVKTRVRGINRFNVFLKVGVLLF